MEQQVTEQEHESAQAEETTAASQTLEDQYGEPNEGPEIEEDARLDVEVTDERTDETMGLDDTDANDATSVDLSEAEGDEGPEGDEAEAADENDPLEVFRRELWAKPGDWFVVHTY